MPLSLKQTTFNTVFKEHLDDLMDFKITIDDLVNIVQQKGVPEAIARMVVNSDYIAKEDQVDINAYWARSLRIYYQERVFEVVAMQSEKKSDRYITSVSYRNKVIDCSIDKDAAGFSLWRSNVVKNWQQDDINLSYILTIVLPEIVHGAVKEFMTIYGVELDQRQAPMVQEPEELLEEPEELGELDEQLEELAPEQSLEVQEHLTSFETPGDYDGQDPVNLRTLYITADTDRYRLMARVGTAMQTKKVISIEYNNMDLQCVIFLKDELSNHIDLADSIAPGWVNLQIPADVYRRITRFIRN